MSTKLPAADPANMSEFDSTMIQVNARFQRAAYGAVSAVVKAVFKHAKIAAADVPSDKRPQWLRQVALDTCETADAARATRELFAALKPNSISQNVGRTLDAMTDGDGDGDGDPAETNTVEIILLMVNANGERVEKPRKLSIGAGMTLEGVKLA